MRGWVQEAYVETWPLKAFFLTKCWFASFRACMSHSLNSLKGRYIGDYRGLLPSSGAIKGDTRSLAYSSHAGSKIAVFDPSLGGGHKSHHTGPGDSWKPLPWL